MVLKTYDRERRQVRQHAAWITLENDFESHECQVLDVSRNGAKVVADIDGAAGTRLRLSVVPNALARQLCEVVWRRGRIMGLRFVR
jgi:hypothetical protein